MKSFSILFLPFFSWSHWQIAEAFQHWVLWLNLESLDLFAISWRPDSSSFQFHLSNVGVSCETKKCQVPMIQGACSVGPSIKFVDSPVLIRKKSKTSIRSHEITLLIWVIWKVVRILRNAAQWRWEQAILTQMERKLLFKSLIMEEGVAYAVSIFTDFVAKSVHWVLENLFIQKKSSLALKIAVLRISWSFDVTNSHKIDNKLCSVEMHLFVLFSTDEASIWINFQRIFNFWV